MDFKTPLVQPPTASWVSCEIRQIKKRNKGLKNPEESHNMMNKINLKQS